MALFPQAVWNRQVSYQTKKTEYPFRTYHIYSISINGEKALISEEIQMVKKVRVHENEIFSYHFDAGEFTAEADNVKHVLKITDGQFLYTTQNLQNGLVSTKKRIDLNSGNCTSTKTLSSKETMESDATLEEKTVTYSRKGQDISFEIDGALYHSHFSPDYGMIFVENGIFHTEESAISVIYQTLYHENGEKASVISKKSFFGEADKDFENTSWECRDRIYSYDYEGAERIMEMPPLDVFSFPDWSKLYPDLKIVQKDSVCNVVERESRPEANLDLSFSGGKAVMSGTIIGSCEIEEIHAELIIYSFPEGCYYRDDEDGRWMLEVSKAGIIEYYVQDNGEPICPSYLQDLKNGRAVTSSATTVISSKTESIEETVNRTFSYKRMDPFIFFNDGKEEFFSAIREDGLYLRHPSIPSMDRGEYEFFFTKKEK